jgi:hypothetical protein
LSVKNRRLDYTKAGGGMWCEFNAATGERLLDINFDPTEGDGPM